LFARRIDAVVHLASLPGGACESDPERGWHVNIDATRALTQAAVRHGVRRFIYASSIAVFGDVADRTHVDDDTPSRPVMLYGAHKAMIEAWLTTLGRRGDLDPLSLRLPGLVARPGSGVGLKSAFLSTLFHGARAARPVEVPVSAEATTWLMSARCAAENIAHAVENGAQTQPVFDAMTLPALHVHLRDLVDTLARQSGNSFDVVYTPDAGLERAFGSYPPLQTPCAGALGFRHDGDLDRLVTAALADLA